MTTETPEAFSNEGFIHPSEPLEQQHDKSSLSIADRLAVLTPDQACFRQVVETIADSVVIHQNGMVLYANPAAERNFGGRNAAPLCGCALFDFIAPEDQEAVAGIVGRVLETGQSSGIVAYTCIRNDGSRRDMETIAVRIQLADEVAILNVCRDVTERNRTKTALKHSEARFEALARHSPEAIIAVCERRIVLANDAAVALLGGANEPEIKGRDVLDLSIAQQSVKSEDVFDLLERGQAVTSQVRARFRRLDGFEIDLELTSIPHAHDDKPAVYLIMRDVTTRLRDEERHRYLASHDPLTGLTNRLEFQRRLMAQTRHDGVDNGRFAVHYLDLDNFKTVNDSLGHEIGDRLLQIVASRLRLATRSTDLVARLGGDEFAVLQSEISTPDAPRRLAEKLIGAIEQPCSVADHLLHTSTTIGIAIFPDHGESPDQLLRHADLALYNAKECGRNAVGIFCSDLDMRVRERDALVNQLIRAETEQEFEVHFQPIASLKSGKVEAVEALLRWNHPERGLMTADEFIHAIEASREGQRIGAWVLGEACRHAKRWESLGIGSLRVAVNLSMPLLQRPDFTELVLGALETTGLAPEKLELELTERIIISAGAAGIAQKLVRLRDVGVHIALDDFGTGYSSLALLKDMPVDRIKIDRSFVAGFGLRADDTAIVRAVTNLGLSMNKKVTAEGVESQEIVKRLRAEGCHDIQGYHLARPMSAPALIQFLTHPNSSLGGPETQPLDA